MSAIQPNAVGPAARRAHRRRAAAFGAGLAVLALAAAGQAEAASSRPAASCAAVKADGAWTRLAPPTFASGSKIITAFAVGSDNGTVYATNGSSVLKSTDLGCSWRSVLTAGSSGSSGTSGERIVRLVTPRSGSAGTVYAAIEQTPAGVDSSPTTLVQASTDTGGHWSAGKALPGTLVDIAAGSGTGARTVYALLRQSPISAPPAGTLPAPTITAQTALVLARSDNAGADWQPAVTQANGPSINGPQLAADAPNAPFTGLAVDPGNAQHVWLSSGPGGLFESTDGGSSTTKVAGSDNGVGIVRTGQTAKGTTQLGYTFLKSRFPAVGYTRPDQKKSNPNVAAVAQLPAPVSSLTMGVRPGEFIASGTDHKVYLHRPAVGFSEPVLDVSPGKAHLRDLTAVRPGAAKDVTVYGRDGNQIEFRTMPVPVPPTQFLTRDGKPPTKSTFSYDPRKPFVGTPPTITPDHVQIAMPVGSQREMPYALSLPGSRKVDVFFLVDTTDSMADKIQAMKQGLTKIVNGFNRANIDARFGVGQYRSYATAPAYERTSDLVPTGPQLSAAVNGLTANGGNHQQTTLDALYQIATGKGLSSGAAFIAPGQRTHWRSDALHVVLNVTDEGFAKDDPHPSFAKVAAALNAENVLQIGVGYQGDAVTQILNNNYNGLNTNTVADLQNMARLTHAVAPPTGADCNGDGQVDVLPGEPLVCVIDPKRAADVSLLAQAIVNVVLAAPDFAPVSVTWEASKPVIAGVTPRVAPGVNLRFPATLSFRVTYACPADLPPGTGYPATLTARVRTSVVAIAKALIDCQGSPLPIVGAAPLAAVAAVSVPGPPTQPITQGQPQGQPQSQPQSQAQAQAQAGAAYQEEQAPQLAFAYTENGTAPEPEQSWEFSAYHPHHTDPSPSPLWTFGAGSMGALSAGWVLATRRRQQQARATVRRRR